MKNMVGLDDERAEIGARLYRSYYSKRGIYLNHAYEGIEDTLIKLKKMGCMLAICTSKYEPFAEEILGILGLSNDFDAVCGSNIDGSRKDKKDLIPYAVACLGGDIERDRERTVMLGDTWYDAQGARLCNVDFIGVRYGYGDVEAMKEQGAAAFADAPGELYSLLK